MRHVPLFEFTKRGTRRLIGAANVSADGYASIHVTDPDAQLKSGFGVDYTPVGVIAYRPRCICRLGTKSRKPVEDCIIHGERTLKNTPNVWSDMQIGTRVPKITFEELG